MQWFVWSKMQTAAGEGLEAIIARKEAERAAGGGIFWWGIGNSVGKAACAAAEMTGSLPVLFSVMLTPPKRIDTKPRNVYLWTAYEDAAGNVCDLPAHVIVTSRDSGRYLRQYALVCESSIPLTLGNHGPFDPRQCLTRGGKQPASSQVTGLLQADLGVGHDSGAYHIAFRARLVRPWAVKLARPKVLAHKEWHQLAAWTVADWLPLVKALRAEQI